MQEKDLTIVIPTLNEEPNIAELIDQIQSILPNSSIIVSDDGSTDRTQKIVKSYESEKIHLLDRSDAEIKGLSAAIRDGILQCKTKGFMVIDGDFQHPPESLLEALTCFKQGADIVIGYRIKVEEWPLTRRMMSWGAQVLSYLSLLFRGKQRPKDIMSGFFGGKTEVVKPLLENGHIALKGYKLLFDILKVLPNDAEIKQFGYIFRNREYGDSKIGKKQIIEFAKSIFK